MEHYIISENCEKEIKEMLCVPEKECVLVQMGLSIREVNIYILIDSKVVVNDRKNSINRIWT